MALSFSFLLWKKGGKPEVPVGLPTFRGSRHLYGDLVERLTLECGSLPPKPGEDQDLWPFTRHPAVSS